MTPVSNTRQAASLLQFRRRLLSWYDRSRRDLPWRRDRDPYHIWLSEIMLQQTRVAAVVDYYQRFLQRFPTVEKLAAARESSVLAAWSGLGYYRRARMLHVAAKKIVREHGGKFPSTSATLRTLPGIGRYTSAAIASIAFDEPVAVVDGNVERVLQRFQGTDLPGEQVWSSAQSLLSPARPGDFNQAMMELGATICVPRKPDCQLCPVVGLCITRGERPSPKNESRRKREVHYVLDCCNDSVFLVERPRSASLMPGMWELPELTNGHAAQSPTLTLRHSITATDYVVKVSRCAVSPAIPGRRVSNKRLGALPLTGLARKILRAARVI
jgi:A/G-specific adenine glycosylase